MGQGYLWPQQCEETVVDVSTDGPQAACESSNYEAASALNAPAVSDTPLLALAGADHDGLGDARPAWAADFGDIDIDDDVASGTPTWTSADGDTTHKESLDLAGGSHTTADRTKTGAKGYTDTSTTTDLLKGRRSDVVKSKDEAGNTESLTTTRGMNKDGQLELGRAHKTGAANGDRTGDASSMALGTDGISGKRTRADVVDGREKTNTQSATVGTDEASFARSERNGIVRGDKDNGSTLYASLGGGFGVSVDIDSTGGRVVAITKVYAEVNGSVGGEAHGATGTKDALKGSAELGLTASAKASYEFRHQLSPAEVETHRDAVLAGEASFLSGLADLHGWSAESASMLGNGDSVKTARTLTAEAALGAELGTLELSGKVKGTGSRSWMAKAEADGIVVTVQAGASVTKDFAGRLQLGAIAIGGELDSKTSDFVRLKSDALDLYDADDLVLYDLLSAAHTRDDIDGLWQAYGAECFERTDGNAASTASAELVGIGPLDVGRRESSSMTSEVTQGTDGLDATFVGQHERETTLGPLSAAGDTNTLTATVANGEAAMTFESQTGWVAPGIPTFDAVKSLGLPKAMMAAFEGSRIRLSKFSLTDLELTQCMERTGDQEAWAACARTISSHAKWVTTGENIRNASAPADWTAASSESFARFTRQLQYLTMFAAGVNDAEHVLFNLTRRYGEPLGDLQEVPGAKSIGTELRVLREDVTQAEERVDGSGQTIERLSKATSSIRHAVEDVALADTRWSAWALTDLLELEERIDSLGGHSADPNAPIVQTILSFQRLEKRAIAGVAGAHSDDASARTLSATLPWVYREWIRADKTARRCIADEHLPAPDLEGLSDVLVARGMDATWATTRTLFPDAHAHWETS